MDVEDGASVTVYRRGMLVGAIVKQPVKEAALDCEIIFKLTLPDRGD